MAKNNWKVENLKIDMNGLPQSAILVIDGVLYRVIRRDWKRNKVWVAALLDEVEKEVIGVGERPNDPLLDVYTIKETLAKEELRATQRQALDRLRKEKN